MDLTHHWGLSTTPGQSETKSNGNERVLHNPKISRTETSPTGFIYPYLPTDRIWHKVFSHSGDLREREVRYEPKFVPCGTRLDIGSLGTRWNMLALIEFPGMKSGDLAGWSPDPEVQCNMNLCLSLILHPERMSCSPAETWYCRDELQGPGAL